MAEKNTASDRRADRISRRSGNIGITGGLIHIPEFVDRPSILYNPNMQPRRTIYPFPTHDIFEIQHPILNPLNVAHMDDELPPLGEQHSAHDSPPLGEQQFVDDELPELEYVGEQHAHDDLPPL